MFRSASLILLSLATCLALLSIPAGAQPSPAAAQQADAGFAVSNPTFADYYQHRGGARVFGPAISREFDLLGTRVQFFQRAVLQLQPNGGVALMNVLDEGLLPYTHINGSTFPAVNPALTQAAPSPAEPGYGARALDFVRAFAPDEFEGLKTNFNATFLNTVTYQEAFPNGGDAALLPLISLEIWGLPTSKPTYDPANGNFVYLRFQRGIMHFDRTTGVTQGILIADYLKSVITGQNLPADLDQDARGSRLYRQYTNSVAHGIARPAELPGTNLFAAFERDGVVVPTPQAALVATAVPPTATLVAATAVPAAPQQPANILVTGSQWFVDQTNLALKQLGDNTNWLPAVKQYVYRIDQVSANPGIDVATRALRVTETAAFPNEWKSDSTLQQEWYAGLIVHHATHLEQAVNGRPYTGPEAENEAFTRQLDAMRRMDTTTNPQSQFVQELIDILNGKEPWFAEWDNPRAPGTTPTPSTSF